MNSHVKRSSKQVSEIYKENEMYPKAPGSLNVEPLAKKNREYNSNQMSGPRNISRINSRVNISQHSQGSSSMEQVVMLPPRVLASSQHRNRRDILSERVTGNQNRGIRGSSRRFTMNNVRSADQKSRTLSHTLTHLETDTTYQVTVSIENKFGWSDESKVFTFYTEPGKLKNGITQLVFKNNCIQVDCFLFNLQLSSISLTYLSSM